VTFIQIRATLGRLTPSRPFLAGQLGRQRLEAELPDWATERRLSWRATVPVAGGRLGPARALRASAGSLLAPHCRTNGGSNCSAEALTDGPKGVRLAVLNRKRLSAQEVVKGPKRTRLGFSCVPAFVAAQPDCRHLFRTLLVWLPGELTARLPDRAVPLLKLRSPFNCLREQ
jgi:hypothetical protein